MKPRGGHCPGSATLTDERSVGEVEGGGAVASLASCEKQGGSHTTQLSGQGVSEAKRQTIIATQTHLLRCPLVVHQSGWRNPVNCTQHPTLVARFVTGKTLAHSPCCQFKPVVSPSLQPHPTWLGKRGHTVSLAAAVSATSMALTIPSSFAPPPKQPHLSTQTLFALMSHLAGATCRWLVAAAVRAIPRALTFRSPAPKETTPPFHPICNQFTWLGSRAVSLAAAVRATSRADGGRRGRRVMRDSSASTTPDSETEDGGSSSNRGPPRPVLRKRNEAKNRANGGGSGFKTCKSE